MEKILLYTLNKEKEAGINKLCGLLGIEVRIIKTGEIKNTVSQLAGLDSKEASNSQNAGAGANSNLSAAGVLNIPPLYMQPEIMIFSGVEDKKLDIFLEEYKKARLQPIKLKAIVTPFNYNWTIYELTKELQKESGSIK